VRHDRLAIVERFECGEFLGVCFQRVTQAVDQLAALERRHARPWAALERASSGRHRRIDILCATRSHFGDLTPSRRVEYIEGLAHFASAHSPPISNCNGPAMKRAVTSGTGAGCSTTFIGFLLT
jgi:hypothetical protein